MPFPSSPHWTPTMTVTGIEPHTCRDGLGRAQGIGTSALNSPLTIVEQGCSSSKSVQDICTVLRSEAVQQSCFQPPKSPFAKGGLRGVEVGHPQSPGKGASPLCTSLWDSQRQYPLPRRERARLRVNRTPNPQQVRIPLQTSSAAAQRPWLLVVVWCYGISRAYPVRSRRRTTRGGEYVGRQGHSGPRLRLLEPLDMDQSLYHSDKGECGDDAQHDRDGQIEPLTECESD